MKHTGAICPQCGIKTDESPCPNCGYDFTKQEPNIEDLDKQTEHIFERYDKENLVAYLIDVLPDDAKQEIVTNYINAKELDADDVSRYIKEKGTICPYCHSNKLGSDGNLRMEGNAVYLEVSCSNCHKIWRDVYALASIEEIDE